jgi:hypothetical protein
MKYLILVGIMLNVLGGILCVADFISPHNITVNELVPVTRTVQVPYQEIENRGERLERAENYWIGEYAYSGYNLEAGKTVTISWQADNTVIVYLMTESQFNIFQSIRLAQNLKSGSGMSGQFSYPITFTSRYYVVIYNPNCLITKVKIIFYQSEITWQETVTKIKNEVQYNTEYVSKQVNSNIYLYSGLALIGLGTTLCLVFGREGKVK